MMCKQRKWSTSILSFDLVSLLVFSVAFVSAHIVITWLVVPYLAVVSTEVRVGHTYLGQYFNNWVVAHCHFCSNVLSSSFYLVVIFGL